MNILKNIKFKVLSTFIIILFIFSMSNIYAVDLVYKATIKERKNGENGIKIEDSIIRTYAKANDIEWQYWRDGVKNNWVYEGVNGKIGGETSYRQCGYLFYGNYKLSDYNSYDKGNGYWARYDTYDGRYITADTEDPRPIIEDFGSKEVYVTRNNNQETFYIEANGTKNNKVYIDRKTQVKLKNFYVLVDDIVITGEFVEELVKSLYKPENVENDYLKIGMSFANHTSADTANARKNLTMKTSYEAVKEMADKYWERTNLGYAYGWRVSYRQGVTTGTSILNHFDNWLYLPFKQNNRTVEIRYMIQDDKGQWIEHKNETKEFSKDAFEIKRMDIDKKYNDYYIGGKMVKGTTKEDAESKITASTNSWGWNKKDISIGASEDEEYYIIEYYYGKRNVVEKHVDLDGNLIEDVKTHSIGLNDESVLSAKENFVKGDYKYVYQYAIKNTEPQVTEKNVKIEKVDGSTTFKIDELNTQNITFYYKKIAKRTLTVKYMVKENDGSWKLVYTDTSLNAIWENSQDYTKKDIKEKNKFKDDKTLAKYYKGLDIDTCYIGGKIASGTTLADAEAKISSTTDSWGWDKTTINIPASENGEHYVVELYYDCRTVSEYHLTTNDKTINSAWNKTYKFLTRDSVTLKAKTGDVYYNNKKYAHVSTEVNGNEYSAQQAKKVTISALDGASSLIEGDKHYVKFYYEYEPPRQIYVRHFVYNDNTGNYERLDVLTNSNAVIKDSSDDKYYLRENGYNQRKDKTGNSAVSKIKDGFNEQYTIDFGDTIKLEKSRTIENEGVEYKYKGVIIKNDTEPSILTTKAQADTLDSTKTIVELKSDKIKKTYVDFYYTQTEITSPGKQPNIPEDESGNEPDEGNPEDNPTIDFVPKDDSGNDLGPDSAKETGDCKVVYVPAGENLKAYMTASTYRPYSLIYDGSSVDPITGKVTYTLKKYDVYKFTNGTIENNSESKYGYINSTEKYGVFNTNSNTTVNPISSVIDEVVKNSVAELKKLNPNEITVVSDGRKTTQADFGDDNIHKVNTDKYNGIRKPSGIAYYNVVSLIKDGTDVYEVKKTKIGVETSNNAQVNVYTPAAIKDIIVESQEVVNHSNQETFVIQKNSEFKVTPIIGTVTDYQNMADTSKYVKYYWIVMDFDVKLLETQIVYNKDSNTISTIGSGQIVKSGNLIQIPKGSSFRAIATNDDSSGDIISQFSNKLKVVAVTYNVTDEAFEKKILSTVKITTTSTLVDKNKTSKVTTNCESESTKQSHSSITDIDVSVYANDMYDDAHYFVEQTKTSKNIGRIYDFKVTDCLDVNFKNVFRKSNNGNVNDLRGIKYFSGVRRLLVYGGNGIQIGGNQNNTNNIFDERANTDNTINSVASKTILPLGPYSHIDANYIQAPKLGYRISFDLKTSGTYTKSGETNREIKITPSYYYISKDGKTYKENIVLYYKNSSGKYVNFAGSGYTIYFKPNDGYRTVYNTEAPELRDMSVKLEALKIGNESFTLTDDMMSYSDNNFVQAWYGEFKLPNSTIAIEEGGNINNSLTDGYIGVKFDIKCIDKEKNSNEETIVSYNQDDKSASPSINTTQWDYEGYLGFARANIGKELEGELKIQLEKDTWRINAEMYKKIKGTVLLYDIDNRAAEDFD